MSADTTMVIFKHDLGSGEIQDWRYCAIVVQAAEDLRPENDSKYAKHLAWRKAVNCSVMNLEKLWWKTLGRAKTFANLLRQEEYVEYDDLLIVEIDCNVGTVHLLSKHGNRIPWSTLGRQRW